MDSIGEGRSLAEGAVKALTSVLPVCAETGKWHLDSAYAETSKGGTLLCCLPFLLTMSHL